jgi:hypothetical protein
MQPLSKTSESQLLTAVKRAVARVDDDGLSPNDAIEKEARELSWGRDMIKLACHAYNTGKQTAQRLAGATALEKFAEFDLADPDAVAEAIWPTGDVKSAFACDVSADYAKGPQWLGAARRANLLKAAGTVKTASAEKPKPGKPVDSEFQVIHTYNEHLRLKRAAEDARYQLSKADDDMLAAAGQLGDYFKKSSYDRLPFAAVEGAALTMHGPTIGHMFNFAYERNRMKEARHKDDPKAFIKVAYDKTREPWTLVIACKQAAEKVVAARAAHKIASDALVAHGDNKLRPFEGRRFAPAADPYLILSEAPVKQASFLTGAVGGSVGAITKGMLGKALGEDNASGVDKNMSLLDDPAHDNELRRIQAQALLTEMMNDDVIGTHAPDQVLSAYNEIAQMAPSASAQPMVMRSLLRRHLQGNIEPFEAAQVADIEKSVRPNSVQPPAPKPASTPNASIFG